MYKRQTEGSLAEPDPNSFSGNIRFFRADLTSNWSDADNAFIYNDNTRILGLADMAAAIEEKRPHRASGELAYHVLDVMCSILDSAESGKTAAVKSTCCRPEPLASGLKEGEIK